MAQFFYKTLTITGSADGALTDYQIRVTAYKSSGTDSGESVYLGTNVRDDFADVVFRSYDGLTPLDYWRDQSTLISGTSCSFWVKVPSIPASPGTQGVRVYYSDSSATDVGDITATMLGGDDFRGARYAHQVASGAAPRWSSGVQKMDNGDVYHTVWNSASGLEHYLYKTTDGGVTAPTLVSTIYGTSSERTHSNLATDGATNFYVATRRSDAGAVYLKRSTDTGATWGSEVTVAGSLANVTDPDPLYVSSSLLFVFVRVTNGSNFEIRCYESTNDGASFSFKNNVHVEATSGLNSLEDIDVTMLSSGRIMIAWERETTEVGEARCEYVYSDDNCATYSSAAVIVNSSGTVDDEGGSFAVDSTDTLHYFFGSNVGGGASYYKQQLWRTTYDEGANTWSTPVLFNESYGGVENNAVYVDDDALLFFCTRQYAPSGGDAGSFVLTATRIEAGAADLSDKGWTQDEGIAYITADGLWVESWTPSTPTRAYCSLDTYSGGDAVIEALVSAPSPLTDVDLRLVFRYGSVNDHYMLSLLRSTTNQVQWYKRVSGTYTLLQSASFTPAINTLYRVVITLRGTNPTTLTVAVNGSTLLSSVTEGTSSRTTGKIGVAGANQLARRATRARHIFARKYTANPPTISAWSTQENAIGLSTSTYKPGTLTSTGWTPRITAT